MRHIREAVEKKMEAGEEAGCQWVERTPSPRSVVFTVEVGGYTGRVEVKLSFD
nr:hypothetical protein [Candidatus Freyrarchaeum guaymaensis]